MGRVIELKASQNDFKDLRVIAEAKKVIAKIIALTPHTILVWPNCEIKEKLQKEFSQSKDKIEKRIEIVENDTVPVNTLVCMNKFGEPVDIIELEWENENEH